MQITRIPNNFDMMNYLDSSLNCHNRLTKNYYYSGLTPEELSECYQLYQISLSTLLSSHVFSKLLRLTVEKQCEEMNS
jgi:hypothetical protein